MGETPGEGPAGAGAGACARTAPAITHAAIASTHWTRRFFNDLSRSRDVSRRPIISWLRLPRHAVQRASGWSRGRVKRVRELPLVLASASPRRAQLLRELGLAPRIMASGVL